MMKETYFSELWDITEFLNLFKQKLVLSIPKLYTVGLRLLVING